MDGGKRQETENGETETKTEVGCVVLAGLARPSKRVGRGGKEFLRSLGGGSWKRRWPCATVERAKWLLSGFVRAGETASA